MPDVNTPQSIIDSKWPIFALIDGAEKATVPAAGTFAGRAVEKMQFAEIKKFVDEAVSKAKPLIEEEKKRITYYQTIETIVFWASIVLLAVGAVLVAIAAGPAFQDPFATAGLITFLAGGVFLFLNTVGIDYIKKKHTAFVNHYQPNLNALEEIQERLGIIGKSLNPPAATADAMALRVQAERQSLNGTFLEWSNETRTHNRLRGAYVRISIDRHAHDLAYRQLGAKVPDRAAQLAQVVALPGRTTSTAV